MQSRASYYKPQTIRRETTQKSETALGGLFRRLSGHKRPTSFGYGKRPSGGKRHLRFESIIACELAYETEDFSQNQNAEPKDVNGSRGASGKRKNKAPDREKDYEARSIVGVDDSPSSTASRPRSVDALASSSRALQRLADIAYYIDYSLTSDIQDVEGTHGGDIDSAKEIRRLREVVETLTYTKSEETENLKRENDKLRSREEDCENERLACSKMQTNLESHCAKVEADLKEDHKKKLQEQRTKAQKQIEARKAEIETEYKQRLQGMDNQIEDLSAMNDDLKQQLSAAEEKLKKKKSQHARLEEILEEDNQKLRSELEQVKSEFPVDAEPIHE